VKLSTIIAVVLIGLGLLASFNGGGSSPDVPVDVTFPAPSAAMQAEVAGIKAFRGKPNAALVGKFYADFAEVLGRDSNIVTTAGQFRAAHQRAQELFAEQTPIAASLPGLSAQIDAVLTKAVGVEDVAISRAKAVEALSAIAWALGGKG
jgi:hypothetical protein